MNTFIYVLKLVNRELMEEMTIEEKAILSEHFEHLQRALTEGKLILAGPCLDNAFGIVIFQIETEQEAEDFMENDPAVKKRIMVAELHPFRISLSK